MVLALLVCPLSLSGNTFLGFVGNMVFALYVLVLGVMGLVYGRGLAKLMASITASAGNKEKMTEKEIQKKRAMADNVRRVRLQVYMMVGSGSFLIGSIVWNIMDRANIFAHLVFYWCIHTSELSIALTLSYSLKPHNRYKKNDKSSVAPSTTTDMSSTSSTD